jgi:diguanylate cyclase (GGDEF)-like protein
VRNAEGTVVQYIGVQHDVSARVTAERALLQERDRSRAYLARIEELAYTDPLTGLPNRRRLEEQVETAIWNARALGDAVALLFLDLDGFKDVNDRLGHAAGDELLQHVAERLRGRLRRHYLLARLGGDEFLVAVVGLDPASAAQEAARVADDLAAAVGVPVRVRDELVSIGASVGISVYPNDGEEFAALLHEADLEMYALKVSRTRA